MGRKETYTYDINSNLIKTVDKNGNTQKNTYDSNNNRKEMKTGNKVTAYVDLDVTLGSNRLNKNAVNRYNALNQLTQTLTKNYRVSFDYDAEGLRTSKTINCETTIFVWDGDQLVIDFALSYPRITNVKK